MTQRSYEYGGQADWLRRAEKVATNPAIQKISLDFLVHGRYNAFDVVEALEGSGFSLTDIDQIIPLSLMKIVEGPRSGE